MMTEHTKTLERIIRFRRGHDCIRFECINNSPNCKPGSGGSHGIHGLSICFLVKGQAGAVQFLLYTGWLPEQIKPNHIGTRRFEENKTHSYFPMPADLGYHSKTPHYDGQEPIDSDCEYCDGEPCYYDGSGLNAYDAHYALVNGGDRGLWEFLEQYYRHVFEDAEYPAPCEYEKPLREQALAAAGEGE
jgi:hypothetical protein